jgi:hypothetical protein
MVGEAHLALCFAKECGRELRSLHPGGSKSKISRTSLAFFHGSLRTRFQEPIAVGDRRIGRIAFAGGGAGSLHTRFWAPPAAAVGASW